MGCFNFCKKGDDHQAADNGPFVPNQGHPTGTSGYAGGQFPTTTRHTVNVQPIAVPSISVDEMKSLTDSFSTKSFIGEGAYCMVYHGVFKNGPHVAIKKLDSSRQPEREFLAQVSIVSRLKHENVVELLGYCVDGALRALAYE